MEGDQASQFFITYRLSPTSAFEGFKGIPIKYGDDYELQFQGDLVWISFQGNSENWEKRRNEGLSFLKTFLSAVALLKEYPFGVEPVQWIEKRRECTEDKYILGRLASTELAVQAKPPKVTEEDIGKARLYLILAEINPLFKRAMIDYSVALSFPGEAVVFAPRALEAVETHFKSNSPVKVSANMRKRKTRDVMKQALSLPEKALKDFHKIANDTTVARHVKELSQLRSPTLEEIRFCIVFCRIVLDKFALYLWGENSDLLKHLMPLLEDVDVVQKIEESSIGLQDRLTKILSGEIG